MTCSKKDLCFYAARKTTANLAAWSADCKEFCEGNYQGCAIFKVLDSVGFLSLPKDLQPRQHERAKQIIAEARGYSQLA